MTVDSAAQILDKTRSTVMGYCRTGRLQATKKKRTKRGYQTVQVKVGKQSRSRVVSVMRTWVEWDVYAPSVHRLNRELKAIERKRAAKA